MPHAAAENTIRLSCSARELMTPVKIKHATTIQPNHCTPKHLPQTNEDSPLHKNPHTNSHSSLLTTANDWKQLSCPSTGYSLVTHADYRAWKRTEY